MNLRSFVLLSCMLVVPALAMFSHLIPAEFRAAVNRRFDSSVSHLPGTTATPVAAGSAPPSSSPASGQGPAPAPFQEQTSSRGARPAPHASPATLPGSAAAAAPEAAVPPQVAQLADRTRQMRDQQAKDQQAVEKQLAALGAVSFECQPLAGPDGLYSSSCRVPVDATGQLQRVFQASGHDAVSASAALLEQVVAWRQRAATLPTNAAADGRADGLGTLSSDRLR